MAHPSEAGPWAAGLSDQFAAFAACHDAAYRRLTDGLKGACDAMTAAAKRLGEQTRAVARAMASPAPDCEGGE